MLIQNWNNIVRPSDQIYMLGDFALCNVERANKLKARLSGQAFWIFGNHDKRLRKDKEFLGRWAWAKDLTEIRVGDQRITLCHYALVTWPSSHHGTWDLYGHSHGSLKDDPHALRLDVGVDCWNYYPVSFEQIKERMSHKTFAPIDHHGRKDEDNEE